MSVLLLSKKESSGGNTDSIFELYSESMPAPSQVEDRIVRVGPTRDIKTIGAGVSAAVNLRGPGQWALVIVDPGVYTEQTSLPDRVAVVGATGDFDDVILEWASPTGYSPLNTYGGRVYGAGFTSRLIPYSGERTGSGIYALHHVAGPCGVFERMKFSVTGANQAKMGMDGDIRSVTWFRECELVSADSGTGVTNMHGSVNNQYPLRLSFWNCIAPHGVNYSDVGSGARDQFYVVGGSVGSVSVSGSNVKAFIDPSVPSVNPGSGVEVVRTTSLPPTPVHGTA